MNDQIVKVATQDSGCSVVNSHLPGTVPSKHLRLKRAIHRLSFSKIVLELIPLIIAHTLETDVGRGLDRDELSLHMAITLTARR
jgi:hypothetical protein